MKKILKEKFNNNLLVKPLYKKLNSNKIRPNVRITVGIDRTFKLDGNDITVKRHINEDTDTVSSKNLHKVFLCGDTKSYKDRSGEKDTRKHVRDQIKKSKMSSEREPGSEMEGIEDKTSKFVQADNNMDEQKMTNTWLRFYPLPKLPEESIRSVIIRCILCQLGLISILILWTIVWVFVIQSFEGPYEVKVSLDFEKAQSLLVIDLATELRQITPISPKWRSAIERRIQDERHLTMNAIDHGARVHPGQFWDLSGTFLFAVYVMTALGFGAPVPNTVWGRTSALVYAFLAVPTHFYLTFNTSMYIVVHTEAYFSQLKNRCSEKRLYVLGRTTFHNGSESPNCSRSSEVLKISSGRCISKKIMRLLRVVGACHSLPLITLLYYCCGAAVFGLARGHTPADTAMFPLEFTSSGGLDRVEGHVRVLYGFYVEGATVLLSCVFATIRRHSGTTVKCLSEKYRLFEYT